VTVPFEEIRRALAGSDAWLVGGAVRDRLMGRPTDDLDVALAGDAASAAQAVRRAVGTRPAAFPLSEAFGAWRVVGPGGAWQLDLMPLQGEGIEADLAARDFTVNAMAEPLAGGPVVDLFGGAADLADRRLRAVGPGAFAADPLRTLRAVRFAVELGFEIEPATAAGAAAQAPALAGVAAERVFAELRRVIASPAPRAGLERMSELGATAAILPELEALRGVEQSVYHHRDVHDHTLEVLDAVVLIERDPAAAGLPLHADGLRALLAEPLAEGLTRGHAMRFAAVLHDIAKPQTSVARPDGRGAGFPGHHTEGADVARAVLRRLRASEKLADHVAALTLHHLRLGFLVREQPLDLRSVHRYLTRTAPVAADVTAFTVADRLATRGRKAEPAIAAHVALADAMLGHALAQRAAPRRAPLVRGDELAAALGRAPGPWLGDLLGELEEARFAGEVTSREEAILRARELVGEDPEP
jgi:tRNA nucleotidyltransferase/poly(A) polymerase